MLFDTGPRHGDASNGGERAVLPFVRARGYRALDTLVVSHADLDHAGGVRSVLADLPVRSAYASFDLPAHLVRESRLRPEGSGLPPLPATLHRCAVGQAWRVDEVEFRFLHPAEEGGVRPGKSNRYSCVLQVRGREHAALLPGDIGAAQERPLAVALSHVDVVLAPHHGSASSSSAALVEAVGAAHVIAQAGHLNRFGHPAAKVEARWRSAGAAFWRTDVHGALTVVSTPRGLRVKAQREAARRYWHDR